MLKVQGLGEFERDAQFEDWLRGQAVSVPLLGGATCRLVLVGYEQDERQEDFIMAAESFLSAEPAILKACSGDLFRYYQDCREHWYSEEPPPEIASPDEAWNHVQFGSEPMVERRGHGDEGVYVSLECSCDWEQEHGLQIVFKNGERVNKLGAFDGHVTNSDAYDQEDLEEVVYVSHADLPSDG